jgi:hypothetical protein
MRSFLRLAASLTILRLAATLFLLACTLTLTTARLAAQDAIDLRGLAAFRAGDDEVWRSKYIDESEGWSFIPVPGAWERAGFPLLDGFGWYRIRFTLPPALRDDSLVLVMSAVDDADETYLNGTGIARTGAFPPAFRSELRSLRLYPLPRYLREEHNLLAIRVYDQADSGGITGSIFRIIRARDIATVLDEIVDEPLRTPALYITSGAMVSAVSAARGGITWTRPRLYAEIEPGLASGSILSNLVLTVERNGKVEPATAGGTPAIGFLDGTGIVRLQFAGGLTADFLHPRTTSIHALVVAVEWDETGGIDDVGISATFDRIAWTVREHASQTGHTRRKQFVLVWHSCCDDLAARDMESLLADRDAAGRPVWDPAREHAAWDAVTARMRFLPSLFSADEQRVYRRSVLALVQAQVREAGAGAGQIVDAFTPMSRARTHARDHLASCEALAEAGLVEESRAGLAFIESAAHGAYTFFAPRGTTDYGVGFPYLVSPAPYAGSGAEYRWDNQLDAVLRYDGMPAYIRTVDALRRAAVREGRTTAEQAKIDSSFIAARWEHLRTRVADILLYRRDDEGLMPTDASPFGPGLSDAPGIVTSLHSAAALRIAARYARVMRDDLRAFLYEEASARTVATVRTRLAAVMQRASDSSLTPAELALFHPLLADAVWLGLVDAGADEAHTMIDIVERGFAIEDRPGMYNAQPDGDWFTRQARPLITLRLARACAVVGMRERAETLFAVVTALALRGDGLVPELVDPVSRNWYGALPAIGGGAAEYVLTAEVIARMRSGAFDR